jgi:hypothetical protein
MLSSKKNDLEKDFAAGVYLSEAHLLFLTSALSPSLSHFPISHLFSRLLFSQSHNFLLLLLSHHLILTSSSCIRFLSSSFSHPLSLLLILSSSFSPPLSHVPFLFSSFSPPHSHLLHFLFLSSAISPPLSHLLLLTSAFSSSSFSTFLPLLSHFRILTFSF